MEHRHAHSEARGNGPAVDGPIVLKFGGTSVGTAAAIVRAGDIVENTPSPVVVLSAAAGETDRLVRLAAEALRREDTPTAREFREAHIALVEELGIDPDLLTGTLQEFDECVRGVRLLADDSPRARDRILAFGELLMAPIFAAHLVGRGLEARALSAAEIGLRTDDRHGRARPLPEAIELLRSGIIDSGARVPVITGFIGATDKGRITTLGRGGSDYSASLVARALGARELQIWTDVDGIHTADPRLVPDARRIDHLTFREASELAFSGARVLHPQTITPAMEGGIPVRVRNTSDPSAPGTSISEHLPEGYEGSRVRSIAHRSGVRVVTVISPRMLARHGFLSRIAEVFDRHALSIDMISTSEVSISLTPDDPTADLEPVVEDLGMFAEVSVEEGRGMVSVVGDQLDRDGAVVAEILTGVAAVGAPIEMISYGATRTNLTFLVPSADLPAVVRALHDRYFASVLP